MSHREQAQESFRKLQQEIKKTVFLKDANQLNNSFARALLDIMYDFMDQVGWPDDEWSINTTLNGEYRPFYHSERRGLGIVVTATILEKPITISMAIAGPTVTGGANTIVFNNQIIGTIAAENERKVPSEEFFPAALAAVTAEAVKALSK